MVACVFGTFLYAFSLGLLVSISGAIITAKIGVLWVQERFGLTVLGLVVFRILWGFVGGHYARFGQFLAKPKWLFKSLKNCLVQCQNQVRNQTVGQRLAIVHLAVAVLFLLGIPLLMAVSGTMSNDDILFDGPLHIWCQMLLTKPQPRITLPKSCFLPSSLCISARFSSINSKRKEISLKQW